MPVTRAEISSWNKGMVKVGNVHFEVTMDSIVVANVSCLEGK